MTPGPLPRLYAILDTDTVSSRGWSPRDVCRAWLDAGVRLIQLRAKLLPTGKFLELADEIASLCREAGALLVINDRADIAVMSGASGVHLGQEDMQAEDVRKVLGDSAIVGLSTHEMGQVTTGVALPISYLAIGPIYATATKDTGYDPVGLGLLQQAAVVAAASRLPLVAIGGMTMERAREVLDAGASSLAVITDLLATTSLTGVTARARAWLDHVS